MAQNYKHCTEKGKNIKPIIGQNYSFLLEPVVEPNKRSQLNLVGHLPDEINRDAYILVAIDIWSKFLLTQQQTSPLNLSEVDF